MLKALRRLSTGHTTAAVSAVRANVEPLERRSHLDTTAPTLVNEQLIGADPRNVEGVVLTFSAARRGVGGEPAALPDRRADRPASAVPG
jgi:hypothetical protein